MFFGCIIFMYSVMIVRRDGYIEGFCWFLMDLDLGNMKKKSRSRNILGRFGIFFVCGFLV